MLRTETEYKLAVQKLADQQARLAAQRESCVESGMSTDETARVLAPLQSFADELQEEVADYEALKRGKFSELDGLRGIGTLLVRMRIASSMTQKELADELGVDPSMISRDERNEYHGVTVERAARILEALGFELRSTVQPSSPDPVRSQ